MLIRGLVTDGATPGWAIAALLVPIGAGVVSAPF